MTILFIWFKKSTNNNGFQNIKISNFLIFFVTVQSTEIKIKSLRTTA